MALMAIVLVAGCGPTIAKVTGTVSVDGEQPGSTVTVYFKRKGSNQTFRSLPQADMSYFLQMPSGQPGIPTGEYHVWIGISPGLEDLPESVRLEKKVPEEYWSESDELTCIVASGGTVFDIDIKSQ